MTTTKTATIPSLDAYDNREQVFQDVDKLIHHTCHQFARQYGGDVEEHYAESCYWFIAKTIPLYNPKAGRSFRGWARMRVFCHLLDITRQQAQRNTRCSVKVSDEAMLLAETRPHFDVNQFKRSLSRDGAIVVHMTTSSWNLVDDALNAAGYGPRSSKEAVKRPKPKLVKMAVARELRFTWEWSYKRIHDAFQEVAQALET